MSVTSHQPILIYEDADKSVDVRLDDVRETVWLSQRQMAEVFDTSTENVLIHLKNIFNVKELDESATAKNFLVVRQEGKREVRREIRHYNLDAIISVGYRVNSKRAVQFRQWATRVLREHLLQGWTLSRQRFETNARELDAAMTLLRKTAQSPALDTASGRGLVDIATRYAQTFLLLQRYDEGLLTEPSAQSGGQLPTLAGARAALAGLKADLIDRGEAIVNDVGLAALTLLVAESDPAAKNVMIRLIMNMLASHA